jgi:L-Lysine epsilon oxidase N-terminal
MEKVAVDRATLNEIIFNAAIYPSIGIARVGNSLTEWYVGPEVPDPLPQPRGSLAIAEGRSSGRRRGLPPQRPGDVQRKSEAWPTRSPAGTGGPLGFPIKCGPVKTTT